MEDVQIVRNLYWKKKANVAIGANTTEQTCLIEKEVQQGCPLSPRLFNMYADEVTRHRTFKNTGMKVNGEESAASAMRMTRFL